MQLMLVFMGRPESLFWNKRSQWNRHHLPIEANRQIVTDLTQMPVVGGSIRTVNANVIVDRRRLDWGKNPADQ